MRQAILSPGDKVLILQNPHDVWAEDIVGTVIMLRPGAGFGGSDLVDIHYKHPRDGRGITQPFGLHRLAAATPELLIQTAERHERLASALRAVAGSDDG
jgi:hypothetical protein